MEMGLALGSKKKEGLWIDDGEALVGEVAVAHLMLWCFSRQHVRPLAALGLFDAP